MNTTKVWPSEFTRLEDQGYKEGLKGLKSSMLQTPKMGKESVEQKDRFI